MGNFTSYNDGKAVDFVNQHPKSSTLEIIRQYARVYSPITSIAFEKLIVN